MRAVNCRHRSARMAPPDLPLGPDGLRDFAVKRCCHGAVSRRIGPSRPTDRMAPSRSSTAKLHLFTREPVLPGHVATHPKIRYSVQCLYRYDMRRQRFLRDQQLLGRPQCSEKRPEPGGRTPVAKVPAFRAGPQGGACICNAAPRAICKPYGSANTQITPPCGTCTSYPGMMPRRTSCLRSASTPQPDCTATYCLPSTL